MNVRHIMKDGTERKSVEGVVIHSEQFYRLLNEIQKKYELKKGA